VTKPQHSLSELEQERVVPWGDPGLFAWHAARYRFALPFVDGKRVLDLGSGEGYGSALLADCADEVVGVDYSPAAVRHAAAAYPRSNVRFAVHDAAALDPSLGRFDAATCFEVIEHIEDQDALLEGLARLLSPTGVLILSTPNRLVEAAFESFVSGGENVYHVNLVSPVELRRRLRRHFGRVSLFGQAPAGNALYSILKALDVLNLRHRLVRAPQVQRQLATTVMGQNWRPQEMRFRFSRLLVRQSSITVAIASDPLVS
jgi:SAM-dependent methyltransferase